MEYITMNWILKNIPYCPSSSWKQNLPFSYCVYSSNTFWCSSWDDDAEISQAWSIYRDMSMSWKIGLDTSHESLNNFTSLITDLNGILNDVY